MSDHLLSTYMIELSHSIFIAAFNKYRFPQPCPKYEPANKHVEAHQVSILLLFMILLLFFDNIIFALLALLKQIQTKLYCKAIKL